MEIINKILELILGYKYYAVVINTNGTFGNGLNYTIFTDTKKGREGLNKYLDNLGSNMSYRAVEVVSFRSRSEYSEYLTEKMSQDNMSNIKSRLTDKISR